MEACMFNKKTVVDLDVKGKKVFVRVDFNVPTKTVWSEMIHASGLLFQQSSIYWTMAQR